MPKSEIKEVLDIVTFIKGKVEKLEEKVDELPTREEVSSMIDKKLEPITNELNSIRGDLKELKQQAENYSGLTKEIDYALERIRVIEKRLGIKSAAA